MSVLDERRNNREGDVTLSSGLVVTIRLIPPRVLVRSGGIPLEAVEQLQETVAASNGSTPQLSDTQIRQAGEFNDRIVCAIVVALDGKPETLTPDDLELITDPEYNELLGYAMGSTPAPFREGHDLTMAELARFAESPGGRMYALSCERYGVDPARGITTDWQEAANLRAALMVASMPKEAEPETARDTVQSDGPSPGHGFLTDDAHLMTPNATRVSHG